MKATATAIFLGAKENEAKTVSNVTLVQDTYSIRAVAFDEKVMKKLQQLEKMDEVKLAVNVYGKVYKGNPQTQVIIDEVLEVVK